MTSQSLISTYQPVSQVPPRKHAPLGVQQLFYTAIHKSLHPGNSLQLRFSALMRGLLTQERLNLGRNIMLKGKSKKIIIRFSFFFSLKSGAQDEKKTLAYKVWLWPSVSWEVVLEGSELTCGSLTWGGLGNILYTNKIQKCKLASSFFYNCSCGEGINLLCNLSLRLHLDPVNSIIWNVTVI